MVEFVMILSFYKITLQFMDTPVLGERKPSIVVYKLNINAENAELLLKLYYSIIYRSEIYIRAPNFCGIGLPLVFWSLDLIEMVRLRSSELSSVSLAKVDHQKRREEVACITTNLGMYILVHRGQRISVLLIRSTTSGLNWQSLLFAILNSSICTNFQPLKGLLLLL